MSCTKNTCNYLGYTTHNMVKYVWVVVKSWHCVDNIHEYIFNTVCNIQYLNLNKNATICKPWLFPAVLLCNCAYSIFKLIWQSTITYSLARWISIHYRYMCIQYLTNIVNLIILIWNESDYAVGRTMEHDTRDCIGSNYLRIFPNSNALYRYFDNLTMLRLFWSDIIL